ncbi:LysR family transcriptional regulator [Pararhodobacter marinus]|uniref:LysR family transcriptional regulator n=1 Tax=Pararhodobacter marinus TaxID=2184063 RepID=UPI0035129E4B
MALNAQTLLTRLTTRARLRHMQALVMLDDLRSMTRAAQAMGMTQPAMTQLVAEMEQLLETTLFLRHSRGVDPTPVAQDLLPVARRILAAMEEGAEAVATRIRRDSGPIRVAATVAAVGALLNRLLPDLSRAQPTLQLMVETVMGLSLSASFNAEDYDIVLCRRLNVVPEGWTFVPCFDDRSVIVAGKRHPLATKAAVTAADLRQCIWLQNHVATLARHAFDALREEHGLDNLQEINIISRIPEVMWSMLREGTAVCLSPRSVALPRLEEGTLVELPFRVNTPLEPMGFYWKPEAATPAIRLLAQGLTDLRKKP